MVASAAETIVTETAKLNSRVDTDNDPFARDVGADLEDVEAVLEDE